MNNKSSKLTYVNEVEEGIFVKKLIQLTWWKSLFNFLKKKRFKNEIKITKYLSEQPLKFFVVPFVFKTDNSSFLQMKKISGQYLKNTNQIVQVKNIAIGLLEFNHYNYSIIFSNFILSLTIISASNKRIKSGSIIDSIPLFIAFPLLNLAPFSYIASVTMQFTPNFSQIF